MNINQAEQIAAAVQASGKYRGLCAELVLGVAQREAAKGRPLKVAVKAARNTLHQIAGAYLDDGTDRDWPYAAWLAELRAAAPDDRAALCDAIMRRHASTRERLPYLAAFAVAIHSAVPSMRSVLDVACGLNPLAALRLGLPADALYACCDCYGAMLAFLGEALPLLGLRAAATTCDITQSPPAGHFDVAFLLKVVPCLDLIDRGAAAHLLARLDADYLVITFPARSLGGRNVGMAATAPARLREVIAGWGDVVRELALPTEIGAVVRRR